MKSLTRSLGFFSNLAAEVFRQPALMLTLIAGPFLVLLAFGQGVTLDGPKPRIIVVRPAEAGEELQPLPEELSQHVEVVEETDDLEAARQRLEDGDVDGVAVLPTDPEGTIRGGERVPLQVITNEIDPVRKSYARSYLNDQVAALNRQTIARAITSAQEPARELRTYIATAREYVATAQSAEGTIETTRGQIRQIKEVIDPLANTANRVADAVSGVSFVVPGLGGTEENAERLRTLIGTLRENVNALDAQVNGSGGTAASIPSGEEFEQLDADLAEADQLAEDALSIPPEVLSAPFQLQLQSDARFDPTFAAFYAPAVLALLMQHLAVTLGALSLARIRLIGLMDVLRSSPVRPSEVVTGNYISYGTLCLVAAAILVALVVILLDVPVFGSYFVLAGGIVLLVAASLGIGFVISLLSNSEQQAAQLSMLLLLCSIFFSGFVFGLDRISWPVRALSYALPSTYGIRSFQDVMLRGIVREPIDFVVLGAAAIVLFVVTLMLFRREFRTS